MNNGKICVSVCAETADEMIRGVRQAEKFADIVEVRFDCLDKAEIERFYAELLKSENEVPLISTFRTREQGGGRELSASEREAFWTNGLETGYSDLEEDIIENYVRRPNRICSHHEFGPAPADVGESYSRLKATGADILKIAVTSGDAADAIPVWKLLKLAKADDKQIIPIAMGEAGKWTRVLGLAHGAYMTYASLDAGKETADGQITACDLIEMYRVRDLDRDTKVFGVIGDPVSQSLSPYMHNPAFVAAGANAVFIPLKVTDLDRFMRRMVLSKTREVELNFGGFSVTMPHKQKVMEYLDAIDPTAKDIGAVNTIKIDGDKLTGYNTDAHGFIAPLRERFGDLNGARVAVFGAGGAARACVFALKQEKADVTVFARDAQKARAVAEQFGVRWSIISNFKFQIANTAPADLESTISNAVPADFESPTSNAGPGGFASQISNARPSDFDIVVHATPLGMKGPHENESLFTADELKGVKFIYDLVTRAVDTPILREAKMAGVPAIGGLEMLIAQGVKQFAIWTGLRAPVEKMKEAVRAQILRT